MFYINDYRPTFVESLQYDGDKTRKAGNGVCLQNIASTLCNVWVWQPTCLLLPRKLHTSPAWSTRYYAASNWLYISTTFGISHCKHSIHSGSHVKRFVLPRSDWSKSGPKEGIALIVWDYAKTVRSTCQCWWKIKFDVTVFNTCPWSPSFASHIGLLYSSPASTYITFSQLQTLHVFIESPLYVLFHLYTSRHVAFVFCRYMCFMAGGGCSHRRHYLPPNLTIYWFSSLWDVSLAGWLLKFVRRII